MLKPKKSVEEMNGYTVPMYGEHWDIKIDSNENNYGAAPFVIEFIRNCDVTNVSFYPFYGELSQKIADYLKCSIDNIKVTNGADEAIQGIIQTYMEKDEKLLTLDISFEMPVIYTKIQGGSVIKVPFEEKWEFPVKSFLEKLNDKKIKIIYISSPNNPTGSIIEEDDLKKILEKSKDKVVIIDETYANYAGITYQKYIKEYDNVFIVRSFSKDFALAGLRLGYIISNEENIKNLKKVISPFSVNSIAMQAGMAALNAADYFEKIRKEIDETKKELKIFFEGMGLKVYPSRANFLLIDCGEKAEFINFKLKQANIAIKLFKKGSLLEGHLRVTIPTKEGFKRIKEVLKIKPMLVFDMDGVLINAKSYRETIRKIYEKYTGKMLKHEEIQKIKNKGGMNNDWDLTKYLLEKEGINVSYQELVDTFQKIYWDCGKGLINIETPLFEREFFIELSKNYNLAIFTGRLREEANFALNKFDAADLFYPIITTDDIPHGKGKPNPTGLNIVKEKTIGIEYYYFGDTTDDILCAKAAGYRAIGVLPPQDKSMELTNLMKEKGAEEVINSIKEITSLLEKNYERV